MRARCWEFPHRNDRDEAVRQAVKALGTTHPAYWREHGYSLKTAERIINELEHAS